MNYQKETEKINNELKASKVQEQERYYYIKVKNK